MSSASLDPWLSGVRRALGLLASPAHFQRDYLSSLGVPGIVDELALEFDDMNTPVKSLLQAAGATEVLSALNAVEIALADPDLEWTLGALEESPAWRRVRELAGHALRETEPLAREQSHDE